jgi:hypothetical protein
VSGWKLCHIHQRPEPRAAEDIGTWQSVFEAIALSAVLTNAGIVAFTSTITSEYSGPHRAWIFFLMVCGLQGVRQVIAFLIPDIPHVCELQAKRNDFIRSKVIDDLGDNEGADSTKLLRVEVNFSIRPIDEDAL